MALQGELGLGGTFGALQEAQAARDHLQRAAQAEAARVREGDPYRVFKVTPMVGKLVAAKHKLLAPAPEGESYEDGSEGHWGLTAEKKRVVGVPFIAATWTLEMVETEDPADYSVLFWDGLKRRDAEGVLPVDLLEVNVRPDRHGLVHVVALDAAGKEVGPPGLIGLTV